MELRTEILINVWGKTGKITNMIFSARGEILSVFARDQMSPRMWCQYKLNIFSSSSTLGLFLLFSFSQGIFSHAFLRDKNHRYFREIKEVVLAQGKDGEGFGWLLSSPGGFSLWKVKDTSKFWPGSERRGSAPRPLLPLGSEQDAPAAVYGGSSLLQPSPVLLHHWASAHESSHQTGTSLAPCLIGKDPATCLGASGEKIRTRAPAPPQRTHFPGCVMLLLQRGPLPAPALLLPLLWVFTTL